MHKAEIHNPPIWVEMAYEVSIRKIKYKVLKQPFIARFKPNIFAIFYNLGPVA